MWIFIVLGSIMNMMVSKIGNGLVMGGNLMWINDGTQWEGE